MVGLVLVMASIALVEPAADAVQAAPDVAVEVAGAVEAAPVADLPLNVLGAALGPDGEVTASASPTPAPTTSSTPPTTIVTPSTSLDVAVAPASVTPSTLAPATTTTAPPPSIEEQALALVRYDWQAMFPNLQIDFLGPRNGLRALTYPAEHRIEVFVRDSDTPASLHRVLAHELGHVIDVELNSPDDRDRWLAQRGLAGSTTWWPNESAPDFATGAGDFAEAFAVWETGVTTQSRLAGQPDEADLALLRELAS